MSSELTLRQPVAAPPEVVWRGVTDWQGQSEWMLATTVRVLEGTGERIGDRISARTGLGPVAVEDPMRITRWEPPRRCVVAHEGAVVRGTGVFEVEPTGEHSCVFVWSELLQLPLGALGRLGWVALRPAMAGGVQHSLRTFAARCEAAHRQREDI